MSSCSLLQPDKFIHEPARLTILTVLSSCAAADFVLQRVTGLTKGNLSVQLSKLEDAKLIKISKKFIDKKSSTSARLTSKGCRALADYWLTTDHMRKCGQGAAG